MEVKQGTRSASQDEFPQEIDDPMRANPERVEQAAQAIRQVVESASNQFWEANVRATKPKSRLIGTMTFVVSTWMVFFAVITLFTLLMGWMLYGTSPLHSLERIAHEQTQERREQAQINAEKEMGAYYVDLGNSLLNVGHAKEANLVPLNSCYRVPTSLSNTSRSWLAASSVARIASWLSQKVIPSCRGGAAQWR